MSEKVWSANYLPTMMAFDQSHEIFDLKIATHNLLKINCKFNLLVTQIFASFNTSGMLLVITV